MLKYSPFRLLVCLCVLFPAFPNPAPAAAVSCQADMLTTARARLSELARTDIGLTFAEAGKLVEVFKSTGNEAELAAWIKGEVEPFKRSSNSLVLAWAFGDQDIFIGLSCAEVRRNGFDARLYVQWRKEMDAARPEWVKPFVEALAVELPSEAWLRFERLDADGLVASPEAMSVLETILADPKDNREREKFDHLFVLRNQFDLAYRLMRLYAEAGKTTECFELASRILQWRGLFHSGIPDDTTETVWGHYGNAALGVAVSSIQDRTKREQLLERMKKAPWKTSEDQLRRVLAEPPAPRSLPTWANLPPGVRCVASNDNVISVCRDDARLYTGHPWGVSIQDFEGKNVVNVPLGMPVFCLATLDGAIWAGTQKGLYRIDLKTNAVSYLRCDQDNPAGATVTTPVILAKKYGNTFSEGFNAVVGLAVQGDVLWIGGWHAVRAYNVKTNRMQVFGEEEIGQTQFARRFIIDGGYVWTENGRRAFRYDPTTGEWKTPRDQSGRFPLLIDIIDGELFGNLPFAEGGFEPCRIDRRTLAVTPIPIQKSSTTPRDVPPFRFFGWRQGKPMFGEKRAKYFFDSADGFFKLLPDSEQWIVYYGSWEFRLGALYRDSCGVWVAPGWDHQNWGVNEWVDAKRWCIVTLPNGDRLACGSRTPHVRYVDFDKWPFSMGMRQPPPTGGMWYLPQSESDSSSGNVPKSSRDQRPALDVFRPRTISIPGDIVFDVVPDEKTGNLWVCTSNGLGVLTRDFRLIANYGLRQGLGSDYVVGGVESGGKFYFANQFGWFAGVTVFDPATGVFSTIDKRDGLTSENVASITRQGEAVKFEYAPAYLGGKLLSVGPNLFHPKHHTFTKSDFKPIEYREAERVHQRRPEQDRDFMPILGGWILGRREICGWTYVFGTRGMLIFKGDMPTDGIVPKEIKPNLATKLGWELNADAEATKIDLTGGLAALKTYVRQSNPFITAKALAEAGELIRKTGGPAVELVAECLKNPEPVVRRTAIYGLFSAKNLDVLPYVSPIIDDPEPDIRAFAALVSAYSGKPVEVGRIEEILKESPEQIRLGNGVWAASPSGPKVVYQALAQNATPEILALFKRYPRGARFLTDEAVFRDLGKAVSASREAVGGLLDSPRFSDEQGWEHYRLLVQRTFKYADPKILPTVIELLDSPVGITRMAAVIALGAAKETSAVPRLVAALNTPFEEERREIALALGEFGVRQAVPVLFRLYSAVYVEWLKDTPPPFESPRRPVEFPSPREFVRQLVAFNNSVSRPSINTSRWKRIAFPTELTPVLDALAKFDPKLTHDFFRILAKAPDTYSRQAAARNLARLLPKDVETDRRLLRELSGDKDDTVKIHAVVGLVRLGDADIHPTVAGLLADGQEHRRENLLGMLADSVTDKSKLGFLRATLLKIVETEQPYTENGRLARVLLERINQR